MSDFQPSYDFAVIGHQPSWKTIVSILNNIRGEGFDPVKKDDITEIFSLFPPRILYNIEIYSTFLKRNFKGAYIETFIDPDKLAGVYVKENLAKVVRTVELAIKKNIPIVSLGGFSSIVLEGNLDLLPDSDTTLFTTGNTLTTAFTLKSLMSYISNHQMDLSCKNVLILGGSGDIGLACARYLHNKVGNLYLVARNLKRLQKVSLKLGLEQCLLSNDINKWISDADIIISATSSSSMELKGLKKGTVIFDVGYPSNIKMHEEVKENASVFQSGMGMVNGGFKFSPDYQKDLYLFPSPKIAHGCALEAVVLAFENNHTSYSKGRGNITPSAIDYLYECSIKHGIQEAFLYPTT
ncbi:MAG: hypothetical protein HKN68_22095 [Saprospiraceae bacterium]|nr:hypothetical protein [Saprospiraceae bacterium]